VWLPPPSQSVSRQGYLPGQLYDLNTPYGTKEELMELLQQFRSAGIAPLADIVINHRCADKQDEMGTWNIFTCDPSLLVLTAFVMLPRFLACFLHVPFLTITSSFRDVQHYFEHRHASRDLLHVLFITCPTS
jgi:hypothetical protein